MTNGIVHGDFQKFGQEEIDVLNQCVNVKLELKDGEETVDVCKEIQTFGFNLFNTAF